MSTSRSSRAAGFILYARCIMSLRQLLHAEGGRRLNVNRLRHLDRLLNLRSHAPPGYSFQFVTPRTEGIVKAYLQHLHQDPPRPRPNELANYLRHNYMSGRFASQRLYSPRGSPPRRITMMPTRKPRGSKSEGSKGSKSSRGSKSSKDSKGSGASRRSIYKPIGRTGKLRVRSRR